MIDNINEKLKQAQIAKDKDDMVKHAERTRQAAINLMRWIRCLKHQKLRLTVIK